MAKHPTETLQDLLARLKIESFDALIVGDGSGSKWDYPIGWGSTLILPNQVQRRVFYGGCNNGTVNMAEIMAYLAPLSWYAARIVHERNAGGDFRVRHIHIITDSEHLQGTGKAHAPVVRLPNNTLWAALSLIERQGFELHWHWCPREDVQLNVFADAVSKAARQLVVGTDIIRPIIESGIGPAECNPDA